MGQPILPGPKSDDTQMRSMRYVFADIHISNLINYSVHVHQKPRQPYSSRRDLKSTGVYLAIAELTSDQEQPAFPVVHKWQMVGFG